MNQLIPQLKEKFESWAKEFMEIKNSEMDESTTRAFVQLLELEKLEPDTSPIPKELAEEGGYRVAKGRAEALGLRINDKALLMIACLAHNPSTTVMYLSALLWVQHTKQYLRIGMNELGWVFPDGFLSEEDLHTMWLKQKYVDPMSKREINFLDWIGKLYV